jgi:hypothetical protein
LKILMKLLASKVDEDKEYDEEDVVVPVMP